jgi:hypothetical protein
VFTQGSAVIYTTDSLDVLKQYLVVTATYDDATTSTVTGYVLSGTLTEGTSKITVTFGGLTDSFNVTVTKNESIPSRYQKVEYIEATGTQFINLNVSFNASRQNVLYLEVKWNDVQTRQLHGGNGGFYCGVVSGEYQMGGSGNVTVGIAASTTQYDTVEYQLKNSIASYTINGTSGSFARSSPSTDVVTLFALSGSDYPCNCKIRRASVSVPSNSFDLIPCYRKSDGAIGMYDLVGGRFYQNAGTGTFAKGGDVA